MGLVEEPTRGQRLAAPGLAFLDRVRELMGVLDVCIAGLQTAPAMPQLTQTLGKLADLAGSPPEDSAQRLMVARRRAEIAKAQIDTGFRVLFEQATVGIWTALEAAVDDTAKEALIVFPEIRQSEPFANIQIELTLYDSMREADKLDYLISAAKDKLAVRRKPGVGRFEQMLNAVGLGGPVPESLRRDLLEMWATRNLLVHRGRTVDRTFVRWCPWLNLRVGDTLVVDGGRTQRFFAAASGYVLLLAKRASGKLQARPA